MREIDVNVRLMEEVNDFELKVFALELLLSIVQLYG